MPKMKKSDVEKMLMLDPMSFAINEAWDLEDMSSKIRSFANHLGRFADRLDERRNNPVVPVTPKAPKSKAVHRPTFQTPSGGRSTRSSRRRTDSTSVKKQPENFQPDSDLDGPIKKKTETISDDTETPEESMDVTSDQESVVAFTTRDVIGCYVSKKFDDGDFRGQVRSVRKDDDEVLYSVTYSDGDKEELTAAELRGKSYTASGEN
jgi:hypothetical protein